MGYRENFLIKQANCTRLKVPGYGSALIEKDFYRQFKIAAVSDLETGNLQKFAIRAIADYRDRFSALPASNQELIVEAIKYRMRQLALA